MPRAEVVSVLGLLKDVDLDADDLLDLVKGLGTDDATIVSMLSTLTADVTWDTSVTYHFLQDFRADVGARLDAILAAIAGPPGPGPAVGVTLTLNPSGGTKSMPPTSITVDTTNEVAVLAFVDDHGNTTTAPTDSTGAPAVLTATSDTPTVATGGPFTVQADGTYSAPVTPAGLPGSVNIGASVQDSTGVDIPLPAPAADGSTTYTAEAGVVALTVNPGAPVGDRLSLA